MSIARTIKRSIAMILSMLMIVTSIDMTALLQVHAEPDTETGHISFINDTDGTSATVKYAFGTANPSENYTGPVDLRTTDDFNLFSEGEGGNYGNIRFTINPTTARYLLDTVTLYFAEQSSELTPDGGGVYSYSGWTASSIQSTGYEVHYTLVENPNYDPNSQGDPQDPDPNADTGVLTLTDQTNTGDYSGTVQYSSDQSTWTTIEGTTLDLVENELSAELYLKFLPAEGSKLDTTAGVTFEKNGTSETVTPITAGSVYSIDIGARPSDNTYEVKYKWEADQGNGGGNTALTVTLDMVVNKPADVSLPELSFNYAIDGISHEFGRNNEGITNRNDFDLHSVEQNDAPLNKTDDDAYTIFSSDNTVTYDSEDNKIDLTLSFGAGMKPERVALVVDPDDQDSDIVLIDENDANDEEGPITATNQVLCEKIEGQENNISYRFSFSDVADAIVEDGNGNKSLNFAVVETAMHADDMAIGSFWYENHESDIENEQAGKEPRNYYIPNGFVEIESVEYEGVTYTSVDIDGDVDHEGNPITGTKSPAKGKNADNEEVDTPNYIYWYSPVKGHGSAIIPKDAVMTVKVTPDFGNQLTGFWAREAKLEPVQSDEENDNMSTYTLTVKGGLYALGVEFNGTANFVAADEDIIVSGGTVTLDEDQEEMDCGTARVTVTTDGVTKEEENAFKAAIAADDFLENAANEEIYDHINDESFDLDQYEVSGVFDIKLDEVVLQYESEPEEGAEEKYWEKPVPTLAAPAEVSLDLGASVKDAFIVHEETDEDGHVVAYEVVGLYNSETKTIDFATASFSNFAILTKGASFKIDSFALDSTTQTLYLSPDKTTPAEGRNWEEEQVRDGEGNLLWVKDEDGNDTEEPLMNGWGTASAFLLTYSAFSEPDKSEDSRMILDVNNLLWQTSAQDIVDVFPAYDEKGDMIGANVHALQKTSKNPVTITATVIDGFDDETGEPIVRKDDSGKDLTASCKVTVKDGVIDVIATDEVWEPAMVPKLDDEGEPVLDENDQPVMVEDWDHATQVFNEDGSPKTETKIQNSFGTLAEAKTWIMEAWDSQSREEYDRWRAKNPDVEDDDEENGFRFWPRRYTVKTYVSQNITPTGANSIDVIRYSFEDGSPCDDFVEFDLNGYNFTLSAPLNLYWGATYTDSSDAKKGTLVANKGIVIDENAEVTFDSNVTTTTFTVSEGAKVYSSGVFKATGLTTINTYSTIVDNNSMTFAAVTLKTEPGPEDPEDPDSDIVDREGDVNFVRFIGDANLPEATLAFNGALTSDDCTRMHIGRITAQVHRGDAIDREEYDEPDPENPEGDPVHVVRQGVLQDIKPANDATDAEKKAATKLCTTTLKALPEFVDAWIPRDDNSGYYVAYLEGGVIYAGRANYSLEAGYYIGMDHVADFATWTDAMKAVAAINDPDGYYCLNIHTTDSQVLGNFKTPKAAALMTYRSGLESETIKKDEEGNERFHYLYDEDGNMIQATNPDGSLKYDENDDPVYEIEYEYEMTPVSLMYTGNLAITCDTLFENVDFVKVDANNNPTDPYSVTTFNMAGNDLTARDRVTFNTPVNFNDAKKTGTLRAEYGSNLWTGFTDVDKYIEDFAISRWYNKDLPPASSYMIIAGSITNVGNVVVDNDQMLIMVDYATASKDRKGNVTYTFNTPGFTPVTLKDNGRVWLTTESGNHFSDSEAANLSTYGGSAVKYAGLAKGTITNAYVGGQGVLAGDALALTNVFLEGDAWIESLNDFTVTGTMSVYTDNAVLATTVNPKNSIPFLTVNGTVVKQNPNDSVQVAVIDPDFEWIIVDQETGAGHAASEDHPTRFVELYNRTATPKTTSAPLLVAKTAAITDFRPFHQVHWNNEGGVEGVDTNLPEYSYKDGDNYFGDAEFSTYNRNGYFTKKTGTTIYVCDGSDVAVAVATYASPDSPYINGEGGDALQKANDASAKNEGKIIGYYASWAEAVAGVNALKTKDNYEFIVVRDIGGTEPDAKTYPGKQPVTITFPTATVIGSLAVVGLPILSDIQDTDEEGNPRVDDDDQPIYKTIQPTIYYTNGWTLTSNTTVQDVALAPVKLVNANTAMTVYGVDELGYAESNKLKTASKGYVSTALPINASAYSLTLTDVDPLISIGTGLFTAPTGKEITSTTQGAVGAITGNGKNEVELNLKPGFTVGGSVTKLAKFTSKDPVFVLGNLQATDVEAHITTASGNPREYYYVTGNVDVKGIFAGITEDDAPENAYETFDSDGSMTVGELKTRDWSVTCNKSFKATKATAKTIWVSGEGALSAGTLIADRIHSRTLTADNVDIKSGEIIGDPGKVKVNVKNLTLTKTGEEQSNCGVFEIYGTATVSDTLTLNENTVLDASKNTGLPITIKDIKMSGPNVEVKCARKTNKAYSVKITGKVKPQTAGLKLTISEDSVNGNADVAYPLTQRNGSERFDTSTKNQIANVGTNPTSVFAFRKVSNGEASDVITDAVGADGIGLSLVKTGGILYNAYAESMNNSIVIVEKKDAENNTTQSSQVVDLATAITEINNENDPNGIYVVEALPHMRTAEGVNKAFLDDTNLADTNPVGVLSLPAINKAKQVTFKGAAKNQTGENGVPVVIDFYGNASGFGFVGFEGIELNVLKNATSTSNTGTSTIKVTNNKAGDDVTTAKVEFKNTPLAEVDSETGSKKQSAVLYGAVGFTVTDLALENTSLTTAAATTVTNLTLTKSDFNADAQATITNVTTDGSLTEGLESFVTAKQNAKTSLPMLTINGGVTATDNKLYIKVKNAKGESISDVTGIPLVLAPKAKVGASDYDSIRAYELRNDASGKIISYRNTANYVINENTDNMLWAVTEDGVGTLTYAKTWNDAITAINNVAPVRAKGDTTPLPSYTIELQQAGIWRADAVVDTESNRNAIVSQKLKYTVGSYVDSAYGTSDVAALTMPKATAADTITIKAAATLSDGQGDDDGDAGLVYKGAFATSTNVVVDNVKVYTTQAVADPSNSRVKHYEPRNMSPLTVAKDKKLTFKKEAVTGLELGGITGAGNKQVGEVVFEACPVKIWGNVSLGTIELNKGEYTYTGQNSEGNPEERTGGTRVEIEGKLNATTLTVGDGVTLWTDFGTTTTKTTLGVGATLGCSMVENGDFTATDIDLSEGAVLSSRKNVNIAKTANLLSNASITSSGTLKIATINVDGTGAKLKSNGVTTITDINGRTGQANGLGIEYNFTNPTNKAAGATMLTISGNVTNTNVNLIPCIPMYDLITGYGSPMPVMEYVDDENDYCHDLTELLNVACTKYQGKTAYEYGSSATWNNPLANAVGSKAAGWYNRKLVNIPKANSLSFTVIGKGNGDSAYEGSTDKIYYFKSNSGLFASTAEPTITVTGYSDSGYSNATYEGQFFALNEAVSEIDRVRVKNQKDDNNAYVKVEISGDLGGEGSKAVGTEGAIATETTLPVAALTMPNYVKGIRIVGVDTDTEAEGNQYPTIYTVGTALTLKSNTEIDNLTIHPRAKANSKAVVYANSGVYSITGKNLDLTLNNMRTSGGALQSDGVYVKDITCGTLAINNGTDVYSYMSGKINVGTLTCGNTKLRSGNITAPTVTLTSSEIDSYGAFTSTGKTAKATLTDSTIQAMGAITMNEVDLKKISTGSVIKSNSDCGRMTKPSAVTVTTVNVSGDGNKIKSYGALTLTNIRSINPVDNNNGHYSSDDLVLSYRFSSPTLNKRYEATTPGASMLTINGDIDSYVNVKLDPTIPVYDATNHVYNYIYEDNDTNLFVSSHWNNGNGIHGIDVFDTKNTAATGRIYKSSATIGEYQNAYYNQSFASIPKASINNIRLYENGAPLQFYKHNKGLYYSSEGYKIMVRGYASTTDRYNDNHANFTEAAYTSVFYDLNDAMTEIGRIAAVTPVIIVGIYGDLGTEDQPIPAITVPANVENIRIQGYNKTTGIYANSEHRTIYTTGTTLTFKQNAGLDHLTIINRTLNKKTGAYETGTYSINGSKEVDLNSLVTCDGTKDDSGNIVVITDRYLNNVRAQSLSVVSSAPFATAGSVTSAGSLSVPKNTDIGTFIKCKDLSLYNGKTVKAGTYVDAEKIYLKGSESTLIAGTYINAKDKINLYKYNNECQGLTVMAGTTITTANLECEHACTPDNWPFNNRVDAGGAIKVTNLTIGYRTSIYASDVTVTGTAYLNGGTISAGKAYEGDSLKTQKGQAKDGAVTFKDVVVNGEATGIYPNTGSTTTSPTRIYVKKGPSDKKGNEGISRFAITGTVTPAYRYSLMNNDGTPKRPIQVTIRQNTDVNYTGTGVAESGLTEGMILVTAKNASEGWFTPKTTLGNSGGWTYKSGSYIKYGLETPEVRLHEYATVLYRTNDKAKTAQDKYADGYIDKKDAKSIKEVSVSYFATMEDAIAEINTLSRYKKLDDSRVSQYFEDYDIEIINPTARDLLDPEDGHVVGNYNCVEITNAKGVPVALALPTKVGNLRVYSAVSDPVEVRFLGGLTLKSNLELENGIILAPMQYDKAHKIYDTTQAAFNLGTYRLKISATDDKEYWDPIWATNVTGGKNSTLELISTNGKELHVNPEGNISVTKISIVTENNCDNIPADIEDISDYFTRAVLKADGSVSATNINMNATGVSLACINADGNLTATNLDMHSIEYTRENPDPSNENFHDNLIYQNACEIEFGGTGTFTNITRHGDGETRIIKANPKPITVKGIVQRLPIAENGPTGLVKLYDESTGRLTVGTIMATGAKLDPQDWWLGSINYMPDDSMEFHFYKAYKTGSNILSGAEYNP